MEDQLHTETQVSVKLSDHNLALGQSDLLYPIKNIYKVIKNNSFLKKFNSHAILLHPKGKSSLFYFTLSKKGIENESITLKSFNSIFNHVKKSRNKMFDGGSSNFTPLKIVGNFLAKDIQTNDFVVIFLSTNHYLIPADKNEFNNFYDSFDEIKPNLVFELRKFLNINKNNYELAALKLAKSITLDSASFLNSSEAIHQEKIKLLGDLLNTLKHELSNPIFGLKLAGESLVDDEHDEDTKEYLEQIIQCVDNSQQVITNFSTLYEDIEHQELLIDPLIKKVLTLTKSATRNIKFTTEYHGSSDIEIRINPSYLIQPIFNIIINATQAMTENKTKHPKIDIDIHDQEDLVIIYITDNGPGITPELQKKIFSPFVTSKKDGTGLGLTISKSLMNKIGGDISYDEEYQDGARFILIFPKTNI